MWFEMISFKHWFLHMHWTVSLFFFLNREIILANKKRTKRADIQHFNANCNPAFNEGYHFRSGSPISLVRRHACVPDDADLFRDLWLFVICKSMSRLVLQEMLEAQNLHWFISQGKFEPSAFYWGLSNTIKPQYKRCNGNQRPHTMSNTFI